MNNNDIKIISVYGHYEAFINGQFICSGDSHNECENEIDEYLKNI